VIWRVVTSIIVVCLKSFEEILVNLLFSFLAGDHIGVSRCVVHSLNVVDVDPAIVVFVKLGEGP